MLEVLGRKIQDQCDSCLSYGFLACSLRFRIVKPADGVNSEVRNKSFHVLADFLNSVFVFWRLFVHYLSSEWHSWYLYRIEVYEDGPSDYIRKIIKNHGWTISATPIIEKEDWDRNFS